MICDFAQYYNIYDVDSLPPEYAATLAAGLPNESRCMRALTGQEFSDTDIMIAAAVDRLSLLVWQNTEDGQNGKNRPPMLADELTRKDEPKQKLESFETVEEFRERWNAICQRQ